MSGVAGERNTLVSRSDRSGSSASASGDLRGCLSQLFPGRVAGRLLFAALLLAGRPRRCQDCVPRRRSSCAL